MWTFSKMQALVEFGELYTGNAQIVANFFQPERPELQVAVWGGFPAQTIDGLEFARW